MRISALPYLLFGASIVQYATASPLRVVIVSSQQEEHPNLRLGHAVGQIARPRFSKIPQAGPVEDTRGRHACGGKFRNKALQLSNALRHALGLPPIEMHPKSNTNIHGGLVHVTTHRYSSPPFIGTPAPHTVDGDDRIITFPQVKQVHRHAHHGETFLMRVHRALVALGPWEGRAVAFVLGCGIGVLLRMFWVIIVVAYRTMRGESNNDSYEYAIVFDENPAEHILVPPPQYTYEKNEQVKVVQSETSGAVETN